MQTGRDATIHSFEPSSYGVFWHESSAIVNHSTWVVSLQAGNASVPSPTNGSIAVTDLAASPPTTVVTGGLPNCWALETVAGDAAACFNEDTGAQTTTLWRISVTAAGGASAARIGAFPQGLLPENEVAWCGRHPGAAELACCGYLSDGSFHCLDSSTGKPLAPASPPAGTVVNAIARDPGAASSGSGATALAMLSVQNTSSPSGYFCEELAELRPETGTFSPLQPPLPSEECWRHGPYAAFDLITPQATGVQAQAAGQGPWLLFVAWTRGQPGGSNPQRYLVASSAANGNVTYSENVPLSEDEGLFGLAWTPKALL